MATKKTSSRSKKPTPKTKRAAPATKTRAKKPAPKKSASKSTGRSKKGARTPKAKSSGRRMTASPKQPRSPRRGIADSDLEGRPTAPEALLSEPESTPPPHVVEVDEARERVGEALEAFHLETSEGTEPLAEELGEEYVENVTGADDAASQHRVEEQVEEAGGPFVETDGDTEFSDDVDEDAPPALNPRPQPRASSARPN